MMELSKRMRVSMLIVILFCMMCVSTVLAREEKTAQANTVQEAELYAACEPSGSE